MVDQPGITKPDEAKCKSCDASIIWVITVAGKRTPVDAKPVRLVLINDIDPPRIYDTVTGYASHFGTCPESKTWSGKGRKS